MFYMLWRKLYI